MEKLSNPSKTREIIEKYGFDFRKRFGQNFLVDARVLERIIEAAQITKEDLVIEIGPGIGTLTQYLAEAAAKVVSIEIDRNLIPILGETLAEYDNVTVINQDVLKADLNEIIREYGRFSGEGADAGREASSCSEEEGAREPSARGTEDSGRETPALRPVRIVANLPYYITTPILMGLFEKHIPAKSITVMVQKEVADRMQAQAGTKDYGSLSLAVQYYSRPHVEVEVPPRSFMPRPKVSSSVISLDIYETPPVKVENEELFHNIIRAAFSQRRKTLVNSLGNAAFLPVTKEQTAAALKALGLPETVRGEVLTLEQFAELADLLGRAH
jgi:16S rRNA (adenine1518-N6/adenine1519-N6)-dimethyltransferase